MKYLRKGLEFRTYSLNRKSLSDISQNEEKRKNVSQEIHIQNKTHLALKQTKTGSIMS